MKTIVFLFLAVLLYTSAAQAAIVPPPAEKKTTSVKAAKNSQRLAKLQDKRARLTRKQNLTLKEQRRLRTLDQKITKHQQTTRAIKAGDSWIVAVLLSFFLGVLGIDRFYLGYVVLGIIKLLTAGGFGIWALIDFILILVRALKPKGGDYAG